MRLAHGGAQVGTQQPACSSTAAALLLLKLPHRYQVHLLCRQPKACQRCENKQREARLGGQQAQRGPHLVPMFSCRCVRCRLGAAEMACGRAREAARAAGDVGSRHQSECSLPAWRTPDPRHGSCGNKEAMLC